MIQFSINYLFFHLRDTFENEWMTSQLITLYDVAEVVQYAFSRAFTLSNTDKGFELIDIYQV